MNAQEAYEVHLEMFEGPLDLLLYLIKKDDLDIRSVPISQITQEYLDYLGLMKDLNLDVAGDFLVMASTLLQIKAQTLLPSQPAEEEQGPDPRQELISKLLEYQKFKEAAKFLDARVAEYRDVFYRGAPCFSEAEKSLDIRIFDLLGVLRSVLDRAEDKNRVVVGEEFPIETKVRKILALLEDKPYILLRDIFADERFKLSILTCFMALLELIKTQRIFARQEAPFAEILIYKKESPPERVTPAHSPERTFSSGEALDPPGPVWPGKRGGGDGQP
ncbi:MAG: segregation/condensation protein A [Elusimicrobiota bacterium]